MYRSILSLSKTAHQMWRDYPFSQTKMATERAVGVGGRRWQGSGVGGGVDKIWKGGVGGWQYRRGGLHKITGLASSANNEKKKTLKISHSCQILPSSNSTKNPPPPPPIQPFLENFIPSVAFILYTRLRFFISWWEIWDMYWK